MAEPAISAEAGTSSRAKHNRQSFQWILELLLALAAALTWQSLRHTSTSNIKTLRRLHDLRFISMGFLLAVLSTVPFVLYHQTALGRQWHQLDAATAALDDLSVAVQASYKGQRILQVVRLHKALADWERGMKHATNTLSLVTTSLVFSDADDLDFDFGSSDDIEDVVVTQAPNATACDASSGKDSGAACPAAQGALPEDVIGKDMVPDTLYSAVWRPVSTFLDDLLYMLASYAGADIITALISVYVPLVALSTVSGNAMLAATVLMLDVLLLLLSIKTKHVNNAVSGAVEALMTLSSASMKRLHLQDNMQLQDMTLLVLLMQRAQHLHHVWAAQRLGVAVRIPLLLTLRVGTTNLIYAAVTSGATCVLKLAMALYPQLTPELMWDALQDWAKSLFSRQEADVHTSNEPLYQRLGGSEAVHAAVDIFYERVYKDPLLSAFFADKNQQMMRDKQVMFLTAAFGGPVTYSGSSLRAIHRTMLVKQDLGLQQFDAVIGHLVAALNVLRVPANLMGEVMAKVAGLRTEFEAASLWEKVSFYAALKPEHVSEVLQAAAKESEVWAALADRVPRVVLEAVLEVMQSVWRASGVLDKDAATMMVNATIARTTERLQLVDRQQLSALPTLRDTDVGVLVDSLAVVLEEHRVPERVATAAAECCVPLLEALQTAQTSNAVNREGLALNATKLWRRTKTVNRGAASLIAGAKALADAQAAAPAQVEGTATAASDTNAVQPPSTDGQQKALHRAAEKQKVEQAAVAPAAAAPIAGDPAAGSARAAAGSGGAAVVAPAPAAKPAAAAQTSQAGAAAAVPRGDEAVVRDQVDSPCRRGMEPATKVWGKLRSITARKPRASV